MVSKRRQVSFLYTSDFFSAAGEKICSVILDHETTFLTLGAQDGNGPAG